MGCLINVSCIKKSWTFTFLLNVLFAIFIGEFVTQGINIFIVTKGVKCRPLERPLQTLKSSKINTNGHVSYFVVHTGVKFSRFGSSVQTSLAVSHAQKRVLIVGLLSLSRFFSLCSCKPARRYSPPYQHLLFLRQIYFFCFRNHYWV